MAETGVEEDVLAAIGRIVGPAGLIDGDRTARNAADASVLPAMAPVAVVRPADTGELAAVLRTCRDHGASVTVQGGLTGLCGGAIPGPGDLALSLERMTGVIEVDRRAMTLTAWAGTPVQAAQEAAAAEGLMFPIDLGARGSATLGGIVATNAGGNRVLRYGMTRAAVLGLEAVLADGTVLSSLGKMLKNNAGFDLKQLFVGSEGLLGVVTRVVFALQPLPTWTGLALAGVADFDAAADLLALARQRLGPGLSAFEVMWPDYWRMVTENVAGRRDPFAGTHGLYVLIEAQGRDGDGFEAFLEEAFEAGGVADAVVARSLAEMDKLWAIRDASAEIEPVLGDHESFDVGLAPGEVGRFVDTCRARLAAEAPASRAVFFGHAADGNIHVMASLPVPGAEGRHLLERIVYETTAAFAGTISAEHGIGRLKRPWLAHSRAAAEIDLMRRLKAMLDPTGVLNPGKVLPDPPQPARPRP
jgi:FAD/FMN-containing dehydrogenase